MEPSLPPQAPARVRNVAVIGPHGAGKTTLAEALLYDMAVIPSRGRVEEGTTTTDFDPEEIRRALSVGVGVATGEYRDVTLHLLDAPGATDFLAETRQALAVADAAVLVISAARGVDAGAKRHFALAREADVPVLVFINGVEAESARAYAELLKQIRDELDVHAVPLELPVGWKSGFSGDVDLVGLRTWYFEPGSGAVREVAETPSELADEVRRYHTQLVEAIAEAHDDMLERYLSGEALAPAELTAAMRADWHTGGLLPVMCGSAAENLGVRPLLDAIVDLFPTPAERRYRPLEDTDAGASIPLVPSPEAAPVVAIFKTLIDPYLGKLSVFRVLTGTVRPDDHLVESASGHPERLGRLFKLVGKKAVAVDRLGPGEIGAVAKLKTARTGATLVGGHAPRPLRYALPTAPPAIWSVAIAPVARQDEARLAIALAKLREEDPALEITVEPRTHRTVIAAQGPRHLEVALSRLETRYHVAIARSEPQIPYRETVRASASGQGRHKKQTGGRGQFGDVWLTIEPLPRGAGFAFVDAVVGGAVPRAFIPAVEKGVRESLESGQLAGFPIVDVRVTLFDGASHSVDSSEQAFKSAAHLAIRRIFPEADPVLLEPFVEVAVAVAPEDVGTVLADLNARRAHIEGLEPGLVRSRLPLAELAGLLTTLQGHTRGEASVESSFAGYEEVPSQLQARLLATLKARETAAS